MSCDLSTYQCSEKGIILPLVNEYTWPVGARATVYCIGLLYSFIGIAIVADVFMQAIETITSRKKTIEVPDPESPGENKQVDVKIWNGTVANLTLMALGSSAPEILLSIIEIVGNNFKSGDLGPSTIIGSAAFNLMVITAVCIMAIPTGEKRFIENVRVFAVTTVFSVFAYLWLIVVLVLITPDYVDVWEAVATLVFLPLLILIAYLADKNYCGKQKSADDEALLELGDDKKTTEAKGEEGTPDQVNKSMIKEVLKRLRHEKECSENDVAKVAAHLLEKNQSHDRGWYRINAIRNLTGGAKLVPAMSSKTKDLLDALLESEQLGSRDSFTAMSDTGKKAIVEFAAPCAAILEKDGRVRLVLMRHGNLKNRVLVKIETIDGTAEAGSDYIERKETLAFAANETCKTFDIEIIDDNEWEPDEVFFVRLTIEDDQPCVIGKRAICQVIILNDDEPGTIEFDKPSFLFKESVGTALIPVERRNGADGKITVKWKTKDISAVAGRDYDKSSGEVEFLHGERTKNIEIVINDDKEFEKDENFELKLEEVTGGATLGKLSRAVVTIVNDDEFSGLVNRIAHLTNANMDSLRVQKATWGKQFQEAMNVNGGDVEGASVGDYIAHFFTFAWKLIFAFIPPPSIWGGWLTFVVALCVIAVLTAIVGDLASIFGCLIGLRDPVTAITFVALGTSLPDLFASKAAATGEKYADASVGNVTGSNSVNVFLGLGVPWFIASLYWGAQGKSFEVPAGALGFSVVVYTICALIAIVVLIVRRNMAAFGTGVPQPREPKGAELGGKGTLAKVACGVFLISLWILYVLLASMQVYEYIPGF